MADPESTLPTEALLADQAGAAEELRADVERLRRELDAPAPALPRRRGRRGSFARVLARVLARVPVSGAALARVPLSGGPFAGVPLIGVLVIGVLVVGAVVAVIVTATLAPWSDPVPGRGPDRVFPSAGPAAAPRAAHGLPATGPGIDRPGTAQVVTVAPDGTLDVTEQAVLGPGDLRELNLRLPSMAALGGAVAELAPVVHDLRVEINGTAVAPVPTADGPGWAITATDGAPLRTVRAGYRVTDAVVRSRPSDAGRALGVSLPLLGEVLRRRGLPLLVRAEGRAGDSVGGVTCPSAPPAKMLCGEPVEGGWLATVPTEATSPVLLIQLNL